MYSKDTQLIEHLVEEHPKFQTLASIDDFREALAYEWFDPLSNNPFDREEPNEEELEEFNEWIDLRKDISLNRLKSIFEKAKTIRRRKDL